MRFLALPNFSSQHHRHERQAFSQSNLVSDNQSGHLNAQVQDNNLINPWGIAFPPTGPFWIANNHTGTATLYGVDPNTDATTVNPLVVTIAPPPDQTGPAAPTGTVFNSDLNPGLVVNGVTGIAAPLMPWIDAATWHSGKIRSWDAPVAFWEQL